MLLSHPEQKPNGNVDLWGYTWFGPRSISDLICHCPPHSLCPSTLGSSLVSKHVSHTPASGPFAFVPPFIWKILHPYPHGWFPSSFRSLFKLPPRWGIPQPTCWRFRPLTSGCISLFLAFSFLPDTYHHLPSCLFTFLIVFITPSLCLFYSQFISHACNSAWHTIRIWQVLVEWMNLLEPTLRNVLRPLVTWASETMICSSLQSTQTWIVMYLLKATSDITP